MKKIVCIIYTIKKKENYFKFNDQTTINIVKIIIYLRLNDAIFFKNSLKNLMYKNNFSNILKFE